MAERDLLAVPELSEGTDGDGGLSARVLSLRTSVSGASPAGGPDAAGPPPPTEDRPLPLDSPHRRRRAISLKPPTTTEARKLGYLPKEQDTSIAWAPVDMRHVILRGATDGEPGLVWTVDTLFPASLQGLIDSSSVDEGTADALYGLIRMIAPRVVLETGTHKGRSTRAIAKALRDNAELELVPHSYTASLPAGHLYTVDLHDYGLRTSGALLPGTEKYVTQIVGRTPEILNALPLDTLKGIEFAFLDGDHTAEGLEAELIYLEHHRAKECWVAVDNSRDSGWPGVAETLRAVKWPRVSFRGCTGLDLIHMSGG